MSYIFSRALVAASSLGKCLDTDPSAPLSGTPTPNLSLWHDKTMDVSRHSRFGMTCRPLMADLGAELLTSWLAGFHAKTYPLQEKAQESTESAAECGRTWRGWLAKFDPSSCSWKTAQCSFIEDLGESLATFPRSGMTRGGLLWELPMLERHTNATGSGFWPTPQASDNRNRGTASTPAIARRIGAGKQVMLSMCMDGPLNPDWTEWLMGWPIGHTALKPSETAKSPNALPQPFESFILKFND